MLGPWIRRTTFWALDAVKGKRIKEHYQDIMEKMERGTSVESVLNDILQYAQKYVPIYQNANYKELTDFPVINKKKMMAAYEDFRSIEFRDDQKLHEVATSGSSGNPFHAFQNIDKRRRVIAELAYIHDCIGWKIGDRYVFMRAWTGHYNNMGFQQFKQNFIPIEVTNLDRNAMDKLRETLKKDRSIRVLFGYSSALMELANYMLDAGDTPNLFHLNVVVADSDTLTDDGKKKLEKVFGCPVISRYDNEEQGILAYTPANESEYLINSASYYVEILSMDGDYPAKQGETGRIVVTDMYNRAMPFIRWDTGDLAIAGRCDGGRCLTIKSLQGRTADCAYAINGNIVSSAAINNYVCDFYDIRKYQLVQNDCDKFEVTLVCNEDSESIGKIDRVLRKLLGQDIELQIHIVDDIPTGRNGKFKTVIRNYTPECYGR